MLPLTTTLRVSLYHPVVPGHRAPPRHAQAIHTARHWQTSELYGQLINEAVGLTEHLRKMMKNQGKSNMETNPLLFKRPSLSVSIGAISWWKQTKSPAGQTTVDLSARFHSAMAETTPDMMSEWVMSPLAGTLVNNQEKSQKQRMDLSKGSLQSRKKLPN